MTTSKTLVAALLLGSAGMALAAPANPIELLPIGGGTIGTSFVQTVDAGTLIDSFDFSPKAFDGAVLVSLHSLTGPVSFQAGQINDLGFGNLSDNLFDFAFQARVGANTPFTLTVLRAVNDADFNPTGSGSYSVSVNAFAAAVPEPQIWILLMGGLAAVASIAGRDRRRA